MNFPYKVEYDQPKTDGTTGIVEDPEVKVHYSPWCPLTPETRIPVNHNMVVTILEPVPSLRDTYITNVQKMGGKYRMSVKLLLLRSGEELYVMHKNL